MSLTRSYWAADAGRPIVERTVGDVLRDAARDAPDRIALIEAVPAGQPSLSGAARTDRTWTYSELLAESELCARWLAARFAPGEHVAVWAPNIPEWVMLQYGCALAGLVLVTANPALRASELRYVLEQSKSVAIFYAASFRGTNMAAIVDEVAKVRERVCFADWSATIHADRDTPLPVVAPGDPAQIQYTSGTTGNPKGALLHHRGLVTNARFIMDRFGFPTFGTWVTAMPLFHTAGCAMSVLGCAAMRATYVLCQSYDPLLLLQQLEDHRGDCLFGVPTMLVGVMTHPQLAEFDLTSCKLVMSGGSTVPAEMVRELETKLAAKFSIVYGQTEASPIITQTSPDDSIADKADTIGRPLWQVDVKIVDPTSGVIVPVGEQGEICARGYQLMLGYFDMPEATAAAIDGDRWLHTGDLATMDTRGYLTITGRLKDMIIRGGENIYPRQLEDLLFAHAKVKGVAVVGLPDPKWGEVVAAVVLPTDADDPPTLAELHALCRQTLAPHKTPAHWYRADELPLTASGKIQKFRIAELIATGAYKVLT